MDSIADDEFFSARDSSSIPDPYLPEGAEIVVAIRNDMKDWPDDMEDIVVEKRRHTHPTSAIPRRKGGAPFRPGR
jgi:hypothetical protein